MQLRERRIVAKARVAGLAWRRTKRGKGVFYPYALVLRDGTRIPFRKMSDVEHYLNSRS